MSELIQKNLYKSISSLIAEARKSVRSTVNSAMVITYWNIGRLIVENEQGGKERAEYGKAVLKELSAKLTAEFGKGFELTNIKYMRQFFIQFPIYDSLSLKPPIRYSLSTESPNRHSLSDESSVLYSQGSSLMVIPPINLKLSWTHYRHLIRVESEKARLWYMNEAVSENWSTRALERQINSHYYERLLSSQDKQPVRLEASQNTVGVTPKDVLKDPYVLEFLQLKNRPSYTENELESALIDDLQSFLLELGSGFSFVARQKHFDIDGEHFYIDLVFYNFKLKCFVLIDLKRGKLTHQDVGQMDMYLRLFEEKMRGEDDNPTIGLVLCSDKSEAVAKYSVLADSKQLFASKYKLVLPSEEELVREISKEFDELRDASAVYRISGDA